MFNDLSLTWPWNPVAQVFLLLLCLLYLVGLWQARRRYPHEPVKPWRVTGFFSAIALSAFLLLTPVETIARTQLFSVHMAQAVLLMTVCAPLMIGGCPAALLRTLLEIPGIREITRLLTRPLIASLLFNLTFLLWHTPRLFDMAQRNEMLYHTMMVSILATSLLNWWPLIGTLPELRRMSYPMQMLYAFFDGQPVDIFALVLVFTGVSLYPHYVIPPQWELPLFSDQAVGGALLLIPGLVDLLVMSPLFFLWLGQIEKHTRLADERRQAEMEAEEEYEDEYEIQ
ncbi:MAG: cytochrome c oxidase assembly protein [Ktedonobacteraceae bacterium]|nr:cytochrome c oxidase assembly protein [Ktedonobacteraceae bacterium]